MRSKSPDAWQDRSRVQPRLIASFRDRFGADPALVVRAPGRVNLIGEHTDYNDGFVLPIAIDRAVWIALRTRTDERVYAGSLNFQQAKSFSLAGFRNENAGWAEYLKGVAWAMQEAGLRLRGWEGVVAGDVPIGAGLSSSAALEMAVASAFAAVSGLPWDAATMAQLGRRAENEWVGMRCGIMDQMISAAGREGHALLIDCRTLQTEAVPLPPGTVVVVLDTAVRRGLVDSAYNERRAQCEAAALFLGVKALRDATLDQLLAARPARSQLSLDEVTFRRARHVITENARTLEAAEAMRRGEAAELGQLMIAGHASLRDDFEVSIPQMDAMVECAIRQEGCFGARMTGGGFGGCAVALVEDGHAATFAEDVAACYRNATGLESSIYVCTASAGAEVVSCAPSSPSTA